MKSRRVLALMTVVAICVSGCGNSNTKDTTATETPSETVSETVAAETETEPVAETETQVAFEEITTDLTLKDYDNIAVVGDTGYELYSYRADAAEKYAGVVNDLAASLEGKANVYDMVIPLGSGIVLPDNIEAEVGDQHKAMEDIYGMMNDKVKKANCYNALMSHRKEYIYFRTDHHWTALGAYYAYTALCDSMGVTANELASYETVDFPGFVGSFYNDCKDQDIRNNPDTVTAYRPLAKDTSTIITPEGDREPFAWKIIYDVTDYPAGVKYSVFIGGDNPFTEITNNEITDGSSCVVVKESFGNSFVPFLVDHYNKVYVVDYRYYQGTVTDLVNEKGAKDVILLNNLSMIRNKYLVGQLQGVAK